MKQAIIFLVVAVMGITTVAAQSTAPVYVIDGEKVANFNGSQLVGKMVDYYHIDSVNHTHVITTSKSIPEERNGLVLRSSKSNYSIPEISNAERFSPAEAIFVKDGKLIEPFEFVRLSSSVIKTMKVIKDKNNEDFKKYAAQAKQATGLEPKCVIIVTSK